MDTYLKRLVGLFLLAFLAAGFDSVALAAKIRFGRGGRPIWATTQPIWQRMKKKELEHQPIRNHILSPSTPSKTYLSQVQALSKKSSHIPQHVLLRNKYMKVSNQVKRHRIPKQIPQHPDRKLANKIRLKSKDLPVKIQDRKLLDLFRQRRRWMAEQRLKRKHHKRVTKEGKQSGHRNRQQTHSIEKHTGRSGEKIIERRLKTQRTHKQPIHRVKSQGVYGRTVGDFYRSKKGQIERQTGRKFRAGHLSTKRKQNRKKDLSSGKYMGIHLKVKNKQISDGGNVQTHHKKQGTMKNRQHGRYMSIYNGGQRQIRPQIPLQQIILNNNRQLRAHRWQLLKNALLTRGSDMLAEKLHHSGHYKLHSAFQAEAPNLRHLEHELIHHGGELLAEQLHHDRHLANLNRRQTEIEKIHNRGHALSHYEGQRQSTNLHHGGQLLVPIGGQIGIPQLLNGAPMLAYNPGGLQTRSLHKMEEFITQNNNPGERSQLQSGQFILPQRRRINNGRNMFHFRGRGNLNVGDLVQEPQVGKPIGLHGVLPGRNIHNEKPNVFRIFIKGKGHMGIQMKNMLGNTNDKIPRRRHAPFGPGGLFKERYITALGNGLAKEPSPGYWLERGYVDSFGKPLHREFVPGGLFKRGDINTLENNLNGGFAPGGLFKRGYINVFKRNGFRQKDSRNIGPIDITKRVAIRLRDKVFGRPGHGHIKRRRGRGFIRRRYRNTRPIDVTKRIGIRMRDNVFGRPGHGHIKRRRGRGFSRRGYRNTRPIDVTKRIGIRMRHNVFGRPGHGHIKRRRGRGFSRRGYRNTRPIDVTKRIGIRMRHNVFGRPGHGHIKRRRGRGFSRRGYRNRRPININKRVTIRVRHNVFGRPGHGHIKTWIGRGFKQRGYRNRRPIDVTKRVIRLRHEIFGRPGHIKRWIGRGYSRRGYRNRRPIDVTKRVIRLRDDVFGRPGHIKRWRGRSYSRRGYRNRRPIDVTKRIGIRMRDNVFGRPGHGHIKRRKGRGFSRRGYRNRRPININKRVTIRMRHNVFGRPGHGHIKTWFTPGGLFKRRYINAFKRNGFRQKDSRNIGPIDITKRVAIRMRDKVFGRPGHGHIKRRRGRDFSRRGYRNRRPIDVTKRVIRLSDEVFGRPGHGHIKRRSGRGFSRRGYRNTRPININKRVTIRVRHNVFGRPGHGHIKTWIGRGFRQRGYRNRRPIDVIKRVIRPKDGVFGRPGHGHIKRRRGRGFSRRGYPNRRPINIHKNVTIRMRHNVFGRPGHGHIKTWIGRGFRQRGYRNRRPIDVTKRFNIRMRDKFIGRPGHGRMKTQITRGFSRSGYRSRRPIAQRVSIRMRSNVFGRPGHSRIKNRISRGFSRRGYRNRKPIDITKRFNIRMKHKFIGRPGLTNIKTRIGRGFSRRVYRNRSPIDINKRVTIRMRPNVFGMPGHGHIKTLRSRGFNRRGYRSRRPIYITKRLGIRMRSKVFGRPGHGDIKTRITKDFRRRGYRKSKDIKITRPQVFQKGALVNIRTGAVKIYGPHGFRRGGPRHTKTRANRSHGRRSIHKNGRINLTKTGIFREFRPRSFQKSEQIKLIPQMRFGIRGLNKGRKMISQRKVHFKFDLNKGGKNNIRSRRSRRSDFENFSKSWQINMNPFRHINFGPAGVSKVGKFSPALPHWFRRFGSQELYRRHPHVQDLLQLDNGSQDLNIYNPGKFKFPGGNRRDEFGRMRREWRTPRQRMTQRRWHINGWRHGRRKHTREIRRILNRNGFDRKRKQLMRSGSNKNRSNFGTGGSMSSLRKGMRMGGGSGMLSKFGKGGSITSSRKGMRMGGGSGMLSKFGKGGSITSSRKGMRMGGGSGMLRKFGRGGSITSSRKGIRMGGGRGKLRKFGRGVSITSSINGMRMGGGRGKLRKFGRGGSITSSINGMRMGGGSGMLRKFGRGGSITSSINGMRMGGGRGKLRKFGRGGSITSSINGMRMGGGRGKLRKFGRGGSITFSRKGMRIGGGRGMLRKFGRGGSITSSINGMRMGGGRGKLRKFGRGGSITSSINGMRMGGGRGKLRKFGRGGSITFSRKGMRIGGGRGMLRKFGRGGSITSSINGMRMGGGRGKLRKFGRGGSITSSINGMRMGGCSGKLTKFGGRSIASLRKGMKMGGGKMTIRIKGMRMSGGKMRPRKIGGGGTADSLYKPMKLGGIGLSQRKFIKGGGDGLSKMQLRLRIGSQRIRNQFPTTDSFAFPRKHISPMGGRHNEDFGGQTFKYPFGQVGAIDSLQNIKMLGSGRQIPIGGSQTLRKQYRGQMSFLPQQKNKHLIFLPLIKNRMVSKYKIPMHGIGSPDTDNSLSHSSGIGDSGHINMLPKIRGVLKGFSDSRETAKGNRGNRVQVNILLKNGEGGRSRSRVIGSVVPLKGILRSENIKSSSLSGKSANGLHTKKTLAVHKPPVHVGLHLHVMFSPQLKQVHRLFDKEIVHPDVHPILKPVMLPMAERIIDQGDELPRSYNDILNCLSCAGLGNRRKRSVPVKSSGLDHVLYHSFKLRETQPSPSPLIPVIKSRQSFFTKSYVNPASTNPFLRLHERKAKIQTITYLNNLIKSPISIKNATKLGPTVLSSFVTRKAVNGLSELSPSTKMIKFKPPSWKQPTRRRLQFSTRNTEKTKPESSTKVNHGKLTLPDERHATNKTNISPLKISALMKHWTRVSQKKFKPRINATDKIRKYKTVSNKKKTVTLNYRFDKPTSSKKWNETQSSAPTNVSNEGHSTKQHKTVDFFKVLSRTTGRSVLHSSPTGEMAVSSKQSKLDHFMEKVFPHIKQHIYGGHIAPRGRWPWQVTIQRKHWGGWQHICGGTIIKPTVVITAAHCIGPHRNGNLRVVAGDYGLSQVENSEQVRFPERVIIHPGFNGSLRASPHDLSLLRFSKSFDMSDNVLPIHHYHVPEEDNSANSVYGESEIELPRREDPCFITGWSDTPENPDKLSNFLHESQIFLISNRECQRHYPVKDLILNSHVCAFRKHTGTCDGDSGGPLVCRRNNNFRLVGVSSWGMDTCHGRPSVFVRVKNYKKWIDDQLK